MIAPRKGGRKRTDGNHKEIRDGLREIGYTVFDTSQTELSDLVIVMKSGRVALLTEIKPESGGVVTSGEVRFMLQIVQPVYRIFQTLEQAIDVITRLEQELK